MNSKPTIHPTNVPNSNSGSPSNKPRVSTKLLAMAGLVLILVVTLFLYYKNKPATPTHTQPANKTSQNQVSGKIDITKDSFMPQNLTVKTGALVEWQSSDESTTHVIVSSEDTKGNSLSDLKSTELGNGATYQYKFTKAGTYGYYDKLNPTMSGTVVVK